MEKSCDNCKYEHLSMRDLPCRECGSENKGSKKWESKCPGISFHRLNGLTPTVKSCTLKVLEEIGELMQLLGKGQGASGEAQRETGRSWAVCSVIESIDVAQSAITMAYTLCEEYGIDIDIMIDGHEKKLREKGYLK